MNDALSAGQGWSHWPAPAKLNLFLHVTGRRADGYHELQTVFRLLDWGDSVALRVRDDDRIVRCSDLPGVPAEQDLAIRAARLLVAHAGVRHGADIHVYKRIPAGAGLGGGSSDAATVLVALDHLWQLQLGRACLAELGLRLGADVPVFVHGHSAWAEGIGEQLTPIALAQAWYVLVIPRCSVSTATLFAAPELTRTAATETISGFQSGAVCGNAFEPVVRSRYPEVAAALNWLGRHAVASLSGSGGAVFAELPNRRAAESIAVSCPAEFKAVVARGLNRSPLLDAMEQISIGA